MEQQEQHTEIVVRLARIESSIAGILSEFKRLNGAVAENSGDINKIKQKCAVHDSMAVGAARKDESNETWNEVLWNICGGCGKDWRDKVEASMKSLSDTRAKLSGGWYALGILAVVLMQIATFALAFVKK